MTNVELIKTLKACANNCSCDKCPYGEQQECPSTESIMRDAADALEADERLLDQNTKRCEALRKQLRESNENYEKHLNELEAQLPKEGYWIPNSPFTGNCAECGGNGNLKDNYCPNCGAKMRGEHDE